ncbi:MAG TPA: hypothetical protein VFJ52_14470 [Terriglobia bacterium]|jgi:hypothetical protein|nr:hypothetical protein [Terriglobia bacterium]HEU4982716.1 hypothetical protein [Acidobacteriaceae bacterium]
MSQQPSLFPQGGPSAPTPSGSGQEPRSGRVPPWLQYLELSVRVVVRLYLGLIIVVLPWTHFWNNNHLLLHFPHLAFLALNGITRGIVSGLGLLNIWIAVDDAIRFKLR